MVLFVVYFSFNVRLSSYKRTNYRFSVTKYSKWKQWKNYSSDKSLILTKKTLYVFVFQIQYLIIVLFKFYWIGTLSPLFSCICPNMRKKENEMTFRPDQILSVREMVFVFRWEKNFLALLLYSLSPFRWKKYALSCLTISILKKMTIQTLFLFSKIETILCDVIINNSVWRLCVTSLAISMCDAFVWRQYQ